MLGIDGEEGGEHLEKEARNGAKDGQGALANVKGPDARVDVARVHAVDGDVPVLFRPHQALVQLREPDLEVELVVVVEADALAALAVEISQVILAEVRHARGGAHDARRIGAGERRQQAHGEERVRGKVDLVHELEAVLGLEQPAQTARVGAHAGVVAQDVERTARVKPARRDGLDRAQLAHVNLPPLNDALFVAGRVGEAPALLDDGGRVLLVGADARGEHHVGAAAGEEVDGLLTDAVVAAGDEDPFAGQVLDGDVCLGEFLVVNASETHPAAPEEGRLRKGERRVIRL